MLPSLKAGSLVGSRLSHYRGFNEVLTMSLQVFLTGFATLLSLISLSNISPISGGQMVGADANEARIPDPPLLANRESSYFSNPPSLGEVAALDPSTFRYGFYRFTISVPEDAGSGLQAVRINQLQNPDIFDFNPKQSQAFTGKGYSSETAIPLATVQNSSPEVPGEILVVFAQPIQPGNTITLSLSARRNPLYSGVYIFSVSAYPEGMNTQGQMIGTGRISLYGIEH
jgi:hypothetical protein